MRPFSYVRPKDVRGAVAALREHPDAVCIAGGTNLVDLMKLHVVTPGLLVDLGALPLKAIEPRGGGLYVGALVPNSDLAHHATVQRDYPLLAEALLSGASPQLRNMATVGGNLLQRTRCPYFNYTAYACNKREPGSGCSAVDGYNRMHAVLGTSPSCIAVNPSDMCVALSALDAKVHVAGAGGERWIGSTDFHREPGEAPERDTVLERDEVILGIELPPPPAGQRSRYVKVRDRASYEFALVSVAALVVASGGRIKEARLALGGVATKPWRAAAAEAALTGAAVSEESFTHAADVALLGARTFRDNAFKVELAKRTVRAALTDASGLGREG